MSEMTASERPSFAQAFASSEGSSAADSQTATTSATDTAATPNADAIAPPAVSTSPETSTPVQGTPPQERWPDILNNARAKTRAEVESEFRQKFGWAEQVDPQDIAKLQGWSQAYSADPVAWFKQTISDLKATHPHLATQLHSEAARVLAGARQAPQPPVSDLEPDIPVQDQDGRIVAQAYSAGKVKALIAQAVQDAIGQEVGPLKQDFQTRQQQAQHAEGQRQLKESVDGIYGTAISELPHFKEHEVEIANAMAQIPGDPAQALHRAWAKVVLPKLSAKAKAEQLVTLKTNAASSTVNPAGAVVASTKRPTSFNDPSLTW